MKHDKIEFSRFVIRFNCRLKLASDNHLVSDTTSDGVEFRSKTPYMDSTDR